MKSMASVALLSLVLLAGCAEVAVASPVEKVVKLLQDLETDLKNDEKSEQSVYDKYACWCEETTARKASAIEDAKDDMKRLGQDILKLKGTVAVRTDEISELTTSIADNKEAQEESTAARSKENAAWQSESEETKQALAAINTAIDVLKKATKPALLQQDASEQLKTSVLAAVNAMPTKVLALYSASKMQKLQDFAAALSKARGKAGYAPQSATIQGMLADMYTTMGSDLMSSTSTEANKNRAFEDFIATKDAELKKLEKINVKKQREKAEAAAMLSETVESYDDTSKMLQADTDFFDVTKKACVSKTADWKLRSDLRQDEIDGISEALKILTSDEAKKLFAKAIKPGMETLLQLDDSLAAPKQKVATKLKKHVDLEVLYAKLKEKATQSHSLKLAALAAQVRMAKAGHFDKVIKSIDDLIGVLAREQESDTKKRDGCEEQYQDISQESAKLDWQIKTNDAKIDKFQSLIEKREDEKKQTVQEITDTEKNIKDMKTERTTENGAFIQAKKDDLAAIELMKSAKETLMEFYQKNAVKMGSELLQGRADPMEDPDKAPDASFSGKGKRKGQSKGIVAIMTMLIDDLKAEVSNEVKAEAGAQQSFEEATATAEKLLEDLNAKKVSLEGAIASRKSDKTEENKDKKENQGDLDDQNKEKVDIKKDCDYMIAKYSERRGYREAETEALRDAKEFLANYFDSAA